MRHSLLATHARGLKPGALSRCASTGVDALLGRTPTHSRFAFSRWMCTLTAGSNRWLANLDAPKVKPVGTSGRKEAFNHVGEVAVCTPINDSRFRPPWRSSRLVTNWGGQHTHPRQNMRRFSPTHALNVVLRIVTRWPLRLCLGVKPPASLSTLSLDAAPLFLDLLALPRPLALAIFALLPVDTRLRCIEVSRAWRALLADTSFWASVNLSSVDSGVARFSLPLFRAAVAKAGGQLRALDLTGRSFRQTSASCSSSKFSRPTRSRSRRFVWTDMCLPEECAHYFKQLPGFFFVTRPCMSMTANLRVPCCATSHRSRLFDCDDCTSGMTWPLQDIWLHFVWTCAFTRRSRGWFLMVRR